MTNTSNTADLFITAPTEVGNTWTLCVTFDQGATYRPVARKSEDGGYVEIYDRQGNRWQLRSFTDKTVSDAAGDPLLKVRLYENGKFGAIANLPVSFFPGIAWQPTPEPQPITLDIDGAHHVLMIQKPDHDARPVLVGETLTDRDGDTYVITGADENRCFVGHWTIFRGKPVARDAYSQRIIGHAWTAADFLYVEWISENA